MSIYLKDAIDNHSLLSISDAIKDNCLFQDGKKTAGGSARDVKFNLQATPEHDQTKAIVKLVQKKLLSNSMFKSATYPDQFANIIISRYEPGMYYGQHVDKAMIKNTRTDIAFTLFLSDPDSYEGGELAISKYDGEDLIKLPAGDAYIYPADSIHQVLPLTSGVRIAIVGWIKSRVRLQQHRDILYDLKTSIAQIDRSEHQQAVKLSLSNTLHKLERLWCD